MKNKNGAVLIITLGFILVFTMLGIASIHFVGEQNNFTERLKRSEQALWHAEAGVELAKKSRPTAGPITDSGTLGTGSYTSVTNSCPNPVDPQLPSCNCGGVPCFNRWTIDSLGTATGSSGFFSDQERQIQAVVSEFCVNNAITSNGTINADCAPDGSAEVNGNCAQFAGFSFESCLGLNYSNDYNFPTPNANLTGTSTTYNFDFMYNDSNYQNAVYEGLVVITSQGGSVNGNKISNTSTKPVFLVIDCTQSSSSTCFKSTGNNNLWGIVWVIGNVDMQGTPSISGALFVDNGNFDGQFNGNNRVSYNEGIVEDALEFFSVNLPNNLTIVSWKEVAPTL